MQGQGQHQAAAAGPRWGGMCLAAAAVTRVMPDSAILLAAVQPVCLQCIGNFESSLFDPATDSAAGPLTPLRQ